MKDKFLAATSVAELENVQLRAHILDLEVKAKEVSDGKTKTEESSSQPAE